jgi:flagellar hook-basal body complex protein FliE
MTTISTMVIKPSTAAEAYNRNASGNTPPGGLGSFGDAVTHALGEAIQLGHNADDQAVKAIGGGGNVTEVVTAISHAEMALQTATAIRDRVVQAYQDIMKMPI